MIAVVQRTLPAQAPAEAAPAIASTLVGALQLARAFPDARSARAHLAAARRSLLAQYDVPP
jgi:hypothetical protein